MNDKSTPSHGISPMSLLLEMAYELGELRGRVKRLEQSLMNSASLKDKGEWLLHQLERGVKVGPTLVHLSIWLAPKLAMAAGLITAYLNGTIAAVLRFLLAHL